MLSSKKSGKQDTTVHRRRVHASKPKREHGHGTWKLVYADFVTVLMAFFLVVWIVLFEKVSKIPEKDMTCVVSLAENLRSQIAADTVLSKGKIPIQIELQHDGLRLTLLDNNQPMFQSGQAVLSEFAKSQFSKIASAVKNLIDD